MFKQTYRDFVEQHIQRLNSGDFENFACPEHFADGFKKYMYPDSMGVSPQTRDEWYRDLTSGFVAENYTSSNARLVGFWENVDDASAISWLQETGKLHDGSDYQFDYLLRYEFDDEGKVASIYEYNDSAFHKAVFEKWAKRKEDDHPKKSSPTQLRWCLFSYPRTMSHLFMRLLGLEHQPSVASHPTDTGSYFFTEAMECRSRLRNWHKSVDQLEPNERSTMQETYDKCSSAMAEFIQSAEEKQQTVFFKEHVNFLVDPSLNGQVTQLSSHRAQSGWSARSHSMPEMLGQSFNGTLLADDFLHTLSPIFLIRHPALAFPSQYRTYVDIEGVDQSSTEQRAEMQAMITIRPLRRLYDWYCQVVGSRSSSDASDPLPKKPIVLDAHDIVHNADLSLRVSRLMGLDESLLQTQWECGSERERQQMPRSKRRMIDTIWSSTGILKHKAPPSVSLEAEMKTWRAEFGIDGSKFVEGLVSAAMPDYDYLWKHRLQ